MRVGGGEGGELIKMAAEIKAASHWFHWNQMESTRE